MKTIDLSHLISTTMPVYPGSESPVMLPTSTLEMDCFVEHKITLYSHAGTHLDVPAHIFAEGKTIDKIHVDHFYGRATVLDVSPSANVINVEDIARYNILLKHVDFVLLYTGWAQRWGTDSYYSGFPVLSQQAATLLASYPLKGIGVDTISVDEVGSVQFPIHKLFLQNEIIIIENLTNLYTLIEKEFSFACFPLKLQAGDGSPIRAVAIIDE